MQEVFVLFLIFYSFPSTQFVRWEFFTIVPAFQPTFGRTRRPCNTNFVELLELLLAFACTLRKHARFRGTRSWSAAFFNHVAHKTSLC